MSTAVGQGVQCRYHQTQLIVITWSPERSDGVLEKIGLVEGRTWDLSQSRLPKVGLDVGRESSVLSTGEFPGSVTELLRTRSTWQSGINFAARQEPHTSPTIVPGNFSYYRKPEKYILSSDGGQVNLMFSFLVGPENVKTLIFNKFIPEFILDRIVTMSVGKAFGFLIFSPTLVCIYFCSCICVVELSLTPPCPSLLPTIFLLSPSIFYSSFALYHGHSRGLKGWYFPNAHWNMRRESFEYCLSMDNECVRKNGFPWHDQLGSYSRIFPLNRSLFRKGGRNEGLGEILRTVDDTSFNHLRQQ